MSARIELYKVVFRSDVWIKIFCRLKSLLKILLEKYKYVFGKYKIFMSFSTDCKKFIVCASIS